MKRKPYLAAALSLLLLAGALNASGCRGTVETKTVNGTTGAESAEQTQQDATAAVTSDAGTSAQQEASTAAAETTATQAAGSTAAAQSAATTASPQSNPVPAQRVGNGVNPITGLSGYDSDYYAMKKVIGVVVENHPGARPQWGMSTPDVTFEYEVEGGISRMLWLYANMDELPAKVGPVRSLRHDIAELARGYDLFLIHCGASIFATRKLSEYNGLLVDIDGNSFTECFVRDTTRDVAYEHKLILVGDAFRASAVNRGFNMTSDGAHMNFFRFANENAPFRAGDATADSVHFEYSSNYTYTFNYDAAAGQYKADINGSPRVDDLGIQCAYKNLILLYVDMEDMHTEGKHQDLLLENGGKGIYAANGGWTEITWQKGIDADMLKLFDASGKELTLNAGKSYIGFVRSTQDGKTVIS